MVNPLYLPEWLRRGLLRGWLLLSAAWTVLVLRASLEAPSAWRIDLPFVGRQYWNMEGRFLFALAPWLLTIAGFAAWWAYIGIQARRKDEDRY